MATFVVTSCLNDDTISVTYSSESSITSFVLGTLYYEVTGTAEDGSDSVYMDTMSMKDYPFTIDQINRTIENKDSLPMTTDISRVVASISADSPYIFYGKIDSLGKEPVDTLYSSGDTINFAFAPAEGLSFKVLAYSGVIGKEYHIKVNVHTQEPDSLTWSEEASNYPFVSQSLIRQKALYQDGKIYVFGENDGTPVIEYTTVSANGTSDGWLQIEDVPTGTESYSALVWKDKIHFIAEGALYELDNDIPRLSDDSPADYQLQQLFACATATNGSTWLYACDSEGKTLVYDGSNWSEEESDASFPSVDQRFSFSSLPLSYNTSIARTVLFGYHADDAGYEAGFAANRLTNETGWNVYDYAQVDTFVCPNIADATMIYYDKKLYAFGGAINSSLHEAYSEPFSSFFSSADNGLTWQPVTRYLIFPSSFSSKYTEGEKLGEGSYSGVVDENDFIWIIWYNGYMSRGRVNRLGFLPKW